MYVAYISLPGRQEWETKGEVHGNKSSYHYKQKSWEKMGSSDLLGLECLRTDTFHREGLWVKFVQGMVTLDLSTKHVLQFRMLLLALPESKVNQTWILSTNLIFPTFFGTAVHNLSVPWRRDP